MTQQQFLDALPESVVIDGEFQDGTVYVGGKLLRIGPSLKIANHSPTGFMWGYGGSGPAQLALAILMRYVDADTALQYYQRFKFGWVAGLPQEDFEDNFNLRQIMTNILDDKKQ